MKNGGYNKKYSETTIRKMKEIASKRGPNHPSTLALLDRSKNYQKQKGCIGNVRRFIQAEDGTIYTGVTELAKKLDTTASSIHNSIKKRGKYICLLF